MIMNKQFHRFSTIFYENSQIEDHVTSLVYTNVRN